MKLASEDIPTPQTATRLNSGTIHPAQAEAAHVYPAQ
jgi:hypothetical protein